MKAHNRHHLAGLLAGAVLSAALVFGPAMVPEAETGSRQKKPEPATEASAQQANGRPVPSENAASGTAGGVDRFHSALSAFITVIGGHSGDAAVAGHQDFGAVLRTLPPGSVDAAEIGDMLKSVEVPKDYQTFLRTILPGYFVPAAGTTEQKCAPYCSDPNILFHSKERPYRAAIDFLVGRSTEGAYAAGAADLIVTGTYTTPGKIPTGLAVAGERVLNPALQPWDGLIVVRADGRILLKNLGRLELDLEPLDIRGNLEHYQKLLEAAAERSWTIVQSHLLIGDGVITVKNRTDAPRFQRRVILQDQGGAIAIYDSRDRQLTLYEAAAEIRRKYAPRLAVNLDMGAYDFCQRRGAAGTLEKCGLLDDMTLLTNVIRIEMR